MPDLHIITGSNGAGKSTVGPDYLPKHIKDNHVVFDGDLIFVRKRKELFPAQTKSVKYANKDAMDYVRDLFDEQTNEALMQRKDYVYEGHFINHETWSTPKKFREAGFTTHLIFLGLENPDKSEIRVAERVASGGHYVNRQTIEDNFYGNLEKLNLYHEIIDDLIVIDTSFIDHKILFNSYKGEIIYSVSKAELPDWFISYLPSLAKLID